MFYSSYNNSMNEKEKKIVFEIMQNNIDVLKRLKNK